MPVVTLKFIIFNALLSTKIASVPIHSHGPPSEPQQRRGVRDSNFSVAEQTAQCAIKDHADRLSSAVRHGCAGATPHASRLVRWQTRVC